MRWYAVYSWITIGSMRTFYTKASPAHTYSYMVIYGYMWLYLLIWFIYYMAKYIIKMYFINIIEIVLLLWQKDLATLSPSRQHEEISKWYCVILPKSIANLYMYFEDIGKHNGRLPVDTWWRHQMEAFSALLVICEGNSPVPGESPHKGQWRGPLMFTLTCVWINRWVNNREASDLRRYRAHYDVTLMICRLVREMLVSGLGQVLPLHCHIPRT